MADFIRLTSLLASHKKRLLELDRLFQSAVPVTYQKGKVTKSVKLRAGQLTAISTEFLSGSKLSTTPAPIQLCWVPNHVEEAIVTSEKEKIIELDEEVAAKYVAGLTRELKFSGVDFDTNGVFHFIATEGGRSAWTNPLDAKRIACSTINGQVVASAMFNPKTDDQSGSGNAQNAWIMIDLQSWSLSSISHYALRVANAYQFPSSWQLQGSVDQSQWDVLSDHVNDQTLNGAVLAKTWKLDKPSGGPYRYIKIQVHMTYHCTTSLSFSCCIPRSFRISRQGIHEESINVMNDGAYHRNPCRVVPARFFNRTRNLYLLPLTLHGLPKSIALKLEID